MRGWLVFLMVVLAGCAAPLPGRQAPTGEVDVLLIGEQHDAPSHAGLHRARIAQLLTAQRLASLALEMVEAGRSTTGLARDASEDDVRRALGWNESAWPWARYGPTVMLAVRAGVPVLGANLERGRMAGAMRDETLDATVAAAALAAQREAVREGHCGLLPESQVAPMTRVQLARDARMAGTLAAAAVPGKVVVLIAGAGHVDPSLGVPRHLPRGLRVESLVWPPEPQERDYCAGLQRQLRAPG